MDAPTKLTRRRELRKEDDQEMDDTQRRVLFQERFVRLRKDFEYNLALLKIREAEIDRCAVTNRNLQHTLTACSNANGVLKARIELLESELYKSESDRSKQREIYHEKLASLTRNVAEKQRECDICERDRQIEITRSVLEVERRYVEMLNKKEVDFGRKMEEVRNKLEHEIMTVAKLTRQLETSFEESTVLKNDLTETRATYTREISIYRREIETLRRSVGALNSTIAVLRKDEQNRRLETAELKRKLRDRVDRMADELTSKIESLVQENESLKNENSQFKLELERCKNFDGKLKNGEEICRIPEHDRFPILAKQNEVLQEIVKTIRKEREMMAQKQTDELKKAEYRVDKLEDVIDTLKRAALSNVSDRLDVEDVRSMKLENK